MLQTHMTLARPGWRNRYSRRVQLGGALLWGAVLPWLVRILVEPELLNAQQVQTTAIANLFAIVLAFYGLRSLAAYPGYRGGVRLLAVSLVPYGLVFLALIALRMDYSRAVLLGGMVLSSLWYIWIFSNYSRERLLSAGVVPFGSVDLLWEVPNVHWMPLSVPERTMRVNAVVADFRAELPEPWERFLADCALDGIPVYHVKDLWESLTGRVRIDHLSENNFGSLIPASAYIKTKYMIDWIAAAVAAVVLFLPGLLVAAMIRADSPGPVFFRQQRTGHGGRTLTVYKFRTMAHRDSEPDAADIRSAITEDGDARITRIGRQLRRYRIDELPQIINILRGEMSWIGPRPEAEALSRWYEQELPFYRYRHILRPGISGWAQVNQGHVTDVEQVFSKLQYDFYYLKHFSPWLDVLIFVRTLQTMLTGFGAR
jgi:lipopolysaccharide/colanic/teichoic acid biosynthesis glycosyltransferase